MRIDISRHKTRVNIVVYTAQVEEFRAAERTFLRARIVPFAREVLSEGRDGRLARRYWAKLSDMPRLGRVLGGTFDERLAFHPISSSGQAFACRELSVMGRGDGCENMSAPDEDVARTRCALIANQKGWYGGKAVTGTCS